MTPRSHAETALDDRARAFLSGTTWRNADIEALVGDASTRSYSRLINGSQTAILMDASQCRDSIQPYIRISQHLCRLGFSAPTILGHDEAAGFVLLEDFGNNNFARLLDEGHEVEPLFGLATDVLIALHQQPQSILPGLRPYDPVKMLDDLEVFLEWRTPGLPAAGKAAFRSAWREILPRAHLVPASLLLRDYHVGNLMLLPERDGIRQVGLLDFQDAYTGPVTYDLVSLLEDARRDLPLGLKQKMLDRYLAAFPRLDRQAFETSMAILAAVRHTRVLGIFERLSRRDGKHDYQRLHSGRVKRLLRQALSYTALARVKRWFAEYAW